MAFDEDDYLQLVAMLTGGTCAIIFLLFVLIDAWKAMRRRAYWFPGGVLVLSALTIQLVNYLNPSFSVHVDDATDTVTIQIVNDTGKLGICVFIAYLLPGMVSSRFRTVWVKIGALVLSVLASMLSEYILLYIQSSDQGDDYIQYSDELIDSFKRNLKWFKVFSTILLSSLILLVLLSICAVFAGKSIRYIIDDKVPVVLSCCSNSPPQCNSIEEHVLKCWIVVRSCQPDYIIARSVFSSLAGLVVTVCVVSIIVKWRCIDQHPYKNLRRFHKPTFIIQFLFVLVGWIVVSLRWLTAVILFPRDPRWWIMEDFWTRSIIEWKHGLDGHLKGRWNLMIALRLHYLLLAIGLCLQTFMVFLSKASWFISQRLFWPLVTSRRNNPPAKFCKYKKVLETVRMPGEIAYSLWIANESAFKQTEKYMEQGKLKISNKELLKLLKVGSAAQEAAETLMREEKNHFKSVGKKCWKMRAASLIHFMLCLYDGANFEMVDDAIKACSQAWDLLDFVHISDPEANLVSRAADKEFCTLHNIWKQHLHMKPAESEAVLKIRNRLKKDIQLRLSSIKESQITVDNMHDSMNWMSAAVNISLSKTWEAIGPSNTADNIRCLLANVIVNCLRKELKKALVRKCSKWAQKGMEKEIYHAAFIAGKATLLLDEIGGGRNAVPQAAAEGEGNIGEAVAHGKDNDASHSRDGKDNDASHSGDSSESESIAEVVEAIVDVEEESLGEQPLLF